MNSGRLCQCGAEPGWGGEEGAAGREAFMPHFPL